MTGQEIRYARSGDVDVAWTITGDGPINIVYVAGFISHLDLARELPVYGSLLGRLDRIGRVLAFNKRGTGLSGRNLGFGSLAERSDDIRAVMDAAGWDCAHLFGVSEGGPLSLLFAAAYPDRVLSLSLYGSFASLFEDDDRNDLAVQAEVDRFLAGVERDWGNGSVLGPVVHAPDDPAVSEQLGRYERACASPRLAAEILRRNCEFDVRPTFDSISAATLVMHRTNDPVVPVAQGRAIARGIEHAQFVELPGSIHCAWDAREWAPVLDELEEFLTGTPRAVADIGRLLATVMFTDIVDSTRLAAESGDRIWHDILDRHESETRRFVERSGGRLVKYTGDGALATFDSPARAVHCTRALTDSLKREGIPLRAGLHTGEVELRADDIGGIGVHIGARIAGLASSGEVLVSRTVRDLVVGSELRFEDAGEHSLKGVPEPWQLYRSIWPRDPTSHDLGSA